jgi:nitrite reductase/ring-hydroxylating ferredoxin subunit
MKHEVGKFYNVTCAELSRNGKLYYIPVIGSPHTDSQFGVHHKHYHIDGRFFISKQLQKHFNIINGETVSIIATEPYVPVKYSFTKTMNKLKKCVRLNTGLCLPKSIVFGTEKHFPVLRFNAFFESFEGKSCKGKKCPHYGTEMLLQEGKLICPLHGLEGDIKTEKIIRKQIIIKEQQTKSFNQYLNNSN